MSEYISTHIPTHIPTYKYTFVYTSKTTSIQKKKKTKESPKIYCETHFDQKLFQFRCTKKETSNGERKKDRLTGTELVTPTPVPLKAVTAGPRSPHTRLATADGPPLWQPWREQGTEGA